MVLVLVLVGVVLLAVVVDVVFVLVLVGVVLLAVVVDVVLVLVLVDVVLVDVVLLPVVVDVLLAVVELIDVNLPIKLVVDCVLVTNSLYTLATSCQTKNNENISSTICLYLYITCFRTIIKIIL